MNYLYLPSAKGARDRSALKACYFAGSVLLGLFDVPCPLVNEVFWDMSPASGIPDRLSRSPGSDPVNDRER